MKLNLDPDKLKETFNGVWQPALAGAVGSGALSTYLSSKSHDPAETRRQRRHRILRNALVGTLMGGAAGAAIPTGAKLLSDPFFGRNNKPPLMERGVDATINTVGRHALPLTVAGIGAEGLRRHSKFNRRVAMENIARSLPGGKFEMKDQLPVVGKPEEVAKVLDAKLTANPALSHSVMEQVERGVSRHKGSDLHPNKLRDMLNEAGHMAHGPDASEPTMGELIRNIFGMKGGRMIDMPYSTHNRAKFLKDTQKWFAEQGPISEQVGKLVDAPGLSLLGGRVKLDPTNIPEIYRRLVRPSVKGRIPLPILLGLLGAGTIGAESIQKRVMGD